MAKNKTYIFRCKEQGPNMWVKEEVKAPSFEVACKKLADRYLLGSGVGTYYLWVMRVTEDNETVFTGPLRMYYILEGFEESKKEVAHNG